MREFVDLCKTFSHERVTASKTIANGPALLFSAHMVAGGDGAATASLYDGHTAQAKQRADLSAPANQADPRTFSPPIYFDQGIYVEVGSNVTSVVLTFKQTKNHSPSYKKDTLRSIFSGWLPWKEKD